MNTLESRVGTKLRCVCIPAADCIRRFKIRLQNSTLISEIANDALSAVDLLSILEIQYMCIAHRLRYVINDEYCVLLQGR